MLDGSAWMTLDLIPLLQHKQAYRTSYSICLCLTLMSVVVHFSSEHHHVSAYMPFFTVHKAELGKASMVLFTQEMPEFLPLYFSPLHTHACQRLFMSDLCQGALNAL